MDRQRLFHRIYVTIFRWCLWFFQRRPSVDKFRRRVVIIGDGLAEGIGDSLAHLGLARRLELLIQKEGRDAPYFLNLRWQVVTEGKEGTTPKDWIPEGSLFKRMFQSGLGKDADVFLILFSGGVSDERDASCNEYVHNICEIASHLADSGMRVVVGAIAGLPPTAGGLDSMTIARNRHLAQRVQELSNSYNGLIDKNVSPDTWKVTQQRALCVDEAGNVNSHGYRTLARLSLDAIGGSLKKVEWKMLRPGLAGQPL